MTTLNCVADGNPAPNITWRLDGQEINLGFPDIELHENGSLTISNVDSNSTGFYTCVASSDIAVSEVTVFVGVEFTETSGDVEEFGKESVGGCNFIPVRLLITCW